MACGVLGAIGANVMLSARTKRDKEFVEDSAIIHRRLEGAKIVGVFRMTQTVDRMRHVRATHHHKQLIQATIALVFRDNIEDLVIFFILSYYI